MIQVVTYTADDGGYHATVEYHGDIIHHPPHPRHHPHPALHRPTLFADPILNEIPSLEKFSPAPEPPLLPKLFVPQDHVLVKKRPFKKPALKLDDLPPPPPPSPTSSFRSLCRGDRRQRGDSRRTAAPGPSFQRPVCHEGQRLARGFLSRAQHLDLFR